MAYYINFRGSEGVETVDEFDNAKEAREALEEYNRAYHGGCYISSRSTKEWRESGKTS